MITATVRSPKSEVRSRHATSCSSVVAADVYCEHLNGNPDGHWMTMVRTATRKLIAVHRTGAGELYDLERDPRDCVNRWADPAYLADKTDPLNRLATRLAFTADPLPERIGVF